jgi:hypothetical protein
MFNCSVSNSTLHDSAIVNRYLKISSAIVPYVIHICSIFHYASKLYSDFERDQSSGMVWFIVAACEKFAVRAFGDCRVCYSGLELGVWVTLPYLSQVLS